MQKKSIAAHKLKQLNISINENKELELTGENAGYKNFVQTLPVSAPCVLFWDETKDNFFALPIGGEVPETAELVDVILRIEE